jgi:F-type H+-transporting ATPase subunit b
VKSFGIDARASADGFAPTVLVRRGFEGASEGLFLNRRWSWAAVALLALLCLLGRRAQAQEPAPPDGDRPRSVTAAEEAPTGEELREPPQIHPKSLAFQLINFGVLLFILIKFGGPAIGKALAARHEQLKAELAAAAEARAAALARLEQQDQRLAALEREIADIRGGIAQEAEAEKARLIALAEERSRRIREETSFALEQQVKEAELRLRREAGLAAVQLAEQLVRKALNAGDQQRLVDGFVGDVASGSKN